MKVISASLVFLGLVPIAASCSTTGEPLQPSAYVEPRMTAARATTIITQARCDREDRCGNIGAGRPYASMEHCMGVERRIVAEPLVEDEDCANGIPPAEAEECIDDIEATPCAGATDIVSALTRSVECSSGSLCLN
jgi:hypothetical protein